jgi:hypothetical protein
LAERFNAAVLKTVVLRGTGGSNPSLSAKRKSLQALLEGFFVLEYLSQTRFERKNSKIKKKAPDKTLIEDYNAIRPHISLNGSTPDEAFSSSLVLPKNLYQSQFKKARTIRITENKKNTCGSCS